MDVSALYLHIDMRESYSGELDDRDTRFGIRAGYVRLVDGLYKRFDILKDFVTIVDFLYTHLNTGNAFIEL